MTIHAKAAGIKLLLLDVDGVLTDGTVIVQSDGSESKPFFIRDGIALVWAQRVGLKVGLLSARSSATTTHRAIGPDGRAAIGLSDGVVRLSVGLEDVEDLIRDLGQALKQV